MRALLIVVAACGGGSAKSPDAPAPDAPPDGPAVTFTLTTIIDNAPGNIAFVAGHDGDGPWRPLLPGNGVYKLGVTTGRYGVAWVCDASGGVNVIEATPGELPAYTATCGAAASTATGTVSNIPSGQTATVYLSGDKLGDNAGATSFTYNSLVEQGQYDLTLELWTTSQLRLAGVVLARDVTVPANGLQHDFDASTAFTAFDSHAISIVGATAGETVDHDSGMYTALGTDIAIDFAQQGPTYRTMPAAQLQAGEVDYVGAAANDLAAGTGRTAHAYFRAPSDTTLTLPALAPTTVTVAATTPMVQLHADFRTASGQSYLLLFYQTSASWLIYVSSGWLAGGTAYTSPDLSVAGWSSSWAAQPGVSTGYAADVHYTNAGFLQPPGDGTHEAQAGTNGQLTP